MVVDGRWAVPDGYSCADTQCTQMVSGAVRWRNVQYYVSGPAPGLPPPRLGNRGGPLRIYRRRKQPVDYLSQQESDHGRGLEGPLV